ncbi:hypothetical protein ACFOY4_33580 [Actinomadura syzygii]|uniref:Uncharacterized protein n=1 Tax=Actinomadura syzygii TaxID=1427538 RepID=A0A5D0U9H6_9ACTN|nr:hypothetical protein [Actinomadura syzygii]TYC15008.1 hypothetical protein FXF65_12830 [Actinomadura syzygii]
MSEVLVTLAEIGAATGRRADAVRAECSARRMSVRDDRAGRPAVTVREARRLVRAARGGRDEPPSRKPSDGKAQQ